ncbi:MAG: hypothetical protein K2O08_04325 [Clostridia bacterium]|nr:hypothetical protein [Clostridia bacterium]
MKKTIATCLLLILILSCALSFVACTDNTDPIVGKYYRTVSGSKYDSAYFIVRKDGTATIYWCNNVSSIVCEQDDYSSWTLEKETGIYSFSGRRGQSSPETWTLVDGNLQDPKVEQHKYIRISDSDWPDYISEK